MFKLYNLKQWTFQTVLLHSKNITKTFNYQNFSDYKKFTSYKY